MGLGEGFAWVVSFLVAADMVPLLVAVSVAQWAVAPERA